MPGTQKLTAPRDGCCFGREVLMVLNLAWFRKMGLVFLEDFTLATLKGQGR